MNKFETGEERRGAERSISLSSVDTDDNDDVAAPSQRRQPTDVTGVATTTQPNIT